MSYALSGLGKLPPAQSQLLNGLTAPQAALWTDASVRHGINSAFTVAIFGAHAPELSFSDVLSLSAAKIVRSASPVKIARSVFLYSLAVNAQLIGALPGLMRAQNAGSAEAAVLVSEALVDIASCNVRLKSILDKIMLAVSAVSPAVSGLGLDPITISVGAAAAIAAVIIVESIVIAALAYWLFAAKSRVKQAEEFCAGRLRTTGVACTGEDYRAYVDSLPPDASGALSNALDKMAKGAGTGVTVIMVGLVAVGAAWLGWKVWLAKKVAQKAL
jgi:hypothetical protein